MKNFDQIPIKKSILFSVSLMIYGFLGAGVDGTTGLSTPQSDLVKNKPNFLILFVDDLGYNDVGFRNPVFHTPNIDRLAQQSYSFDEAYVPIAACSPSRAALLTGRHPVKMRMVRHARTSNEEFHVMDRDPGQIPSRNWLPLEEITLAEALKPVGYRSYFVGKWHLGIGEYHPNNQGFTELTKAQDSLFSFYEPYFKESEEQGGQYLTDSITDTAEEFFASQKAKTPFLLYLAYWNVHEPTIGKKEWLDHYQSQGFGDAYSNYGAQVSAVDESVGRILRSLEENQLDENTIVFFLSDQGGRFTNAPLRGGKYGGQSLCDGGSKVPFLMRLPNQDRTEVIKSPVSSMDIFPTIYEMASGRPYSEDLIDGQTLQPLLDGKTPKTDRSLFLYRAYEDQYLALRKGKWKLIVNRTHHYERKYELYNLDEDISEINNLFYMKPHIGKPLLDKAKAWEAATGINDFKSR